MRMMQDNLADVQNSLKFLVDSCQQTLHAVQKQQEVSQKLLQRLSERVISWKSIDKFNFYVYTYLILEWRSWFRTGHIGFEEWNIDCEKLAFKPVCFI